MVLARSRTTRTPKRRLLVFSLLRSRKTQCHKHFGISGTRSARSSFPIRSNFATSTGGRCQLSNSAGPWARFAPRWEGVDSVCRPQGSAMLTTPGGRSGYAASSHQPDTNVPWSEAASPWLPSHSRVAAHHETEALQGTTHQSPPSRRMPLAPRSRPHGALSALLTLLCRECLSALRDA